MKKYRYKVIVESCEEGEGEEYEEILESEVPLSEEFLNDHAYNMRNRLFSFDYYKIDENNKNIEDF